jgi:hypothetical protein
MPPAQRPPAPGPADSAQSEPGEADDTDGDTDGGEDHEESSYA